jgi:RNA polymerase sigma factor (sigma-70 family)
LAHTIGMMTNEPILSNALTDAELVAQALTGDRDAFQKIVERYKILVCSLAYTATGNLSQSEDIAQETFIVAWTQLDHLAQPEKLRPWLCGIMRNHVRRNARNNVHEPTHAAESLDVVEETADVVSAPVDHAISNEEKAILWRALEKMPEIYREPLVLFYREHQSIETVARDLELTEDAVKQRLSRGRKMLHEQMLAFVEGALGRTVPDKAFSGAVMAMLPMGAASAATATLTAKSGAAAKSGFLATWLAPLAPFIGILAGIGAQWLMIRETTTDRKLRSKKLFYVVAGWVIYLSLFVAGEHTMNSLCNHFNWQGSVKGIAWAMYYWLFIATTVAVLLVAMASDRTRQRESASPETPPLPIKPRTLAGIVAGFELMFCWLPWLAWRMHDFLAVAMIAAAFLTVGFITFFRGKGKTGVALERAFRLQSTAMGATVLLALNLRVHNWISFAAHTDLASAYSLLPVWVIPTLSVVLVLWIALIANVTRLRKSAV